MYKYKLLLAFTFLLTLLACSNSGVRNSFAYKDNEYIINVDDSTKSYNQARKHFIEGKKYQSVADFSKAVECFTLATQTEQSAVIYFNLAVSYLNINAVDSAVYYFEKSIAADSLYVQSYNYLTDIYLNTGQVRKAEILNKGLYSRMPNKENLMNLVNVQFYFDVNSAINNLKKGIDEYNDNELNAYLANVYISLNQIDSANSYFERYINNGITEIYILDKLVNEFINKQDFRICIKHINFLKTHLYEATLDELMDLIYNQIGDFFKIDNELCPILYDMVNEYEPESAFKYFILGSIKLSENKALQADSLFNLVAVSNPIDDTLITKTVITYIIYQKAEKALKYLIKNIDNIILKDDKDLATISSFLYSKKEMNNLIKVLCNNKNKQNIDKYFSILGDAYLTLNSIDSAIKYYEYSYKTDTSNISIRNNLAYCLSLNGKDLKRALGLVEYSIKQQPNNANFLDTHGWINFLLGNVDIAYDSLSKAAKLDSNNYDVMLHLGYIYYRKGEINNALLCWENAYQSSEIENLKIK